MTRALTLRRAPLPEPIAPARPVVFFDPTVRASAGALRSAEDVELGLRRLTTISRGGHRITSRIYGIHEARVLAARPDYFDALNHRSFV